MAVPDLGEFISKFRGHNTLVENIASPEFPEFSRLLKLLDVQHSGTGGQATYFVMLDLLDLETNVF